MLFRDSFAAYRRHIGSGNAQFLWTPFYWLYRRPFRSCFWLSDKGHMHFSKYYQPKTMYATRWQTSFHDNRASKWILSYFHTLHRVKCACFQLVNGRSIHANLFNFVVSTMLVRMYVCRVIWQFLYSNLLAAAISRLLFFRWIFFLRFFFNEVH